MTARTGQLWVCLRHQKDQRARLTAAALGRLQDQPTLSAPIDPAENRHRGLRETEGRFGSQWRHPWACQNRSNIFLTCPPLQGQLADARGRSQQWISYVEKGQHRVSVVEFLEFVEALRFDPRSAIGRIARVKG
jgi:hypothetical protein